MIIEDERDLDLELDYNNVGSRVKLARNPDRMWEFLETYREIEDDNTHNQLQKDIIEHHWQLYGQ